MSQICQVHANGCPGGKSRITVPGTDELLPSFGGRQAFSFQQRESALENPLPCEHRELLREPRPTKRMSRSSSLPIPLIAAQDARACYTGRSSDCHHRRRRHL
jgi:hypothetical protein